MIDRTDGGGTGWDVVADHDDAAALIAAVLSLDEDETYTKNELSEAAGVPYKTLYLDGTVDAVAEVGLLEKRDREGDEPVYAVATDSEAFEAAAAFDAVTQETVDSRA